MALKSLLQRRSRVQCYSVFFPTAASCDFTNLAPTARFLQPLHPEGGLRPRKQQQRSTRWMVHSSAREGFLDAAFYEQARSSFKPDAMALVSGLLHVQQRTLQQQSGQFNNGRSGHSDHHSSAGNSEEKGCPANIVVDVGCGTGKFTRLLAPLTAELGLRLVGVEPVESMRSTFEQVMQQQVQGQQHGQGKQQQEQRQGEMQQEGQYEEGKGGHRWQQGGHPDVAVLEGAADRLPFPDASCRAIFCAQAFHWFATENVLREFSRVLIPDGGLLVLLWNTRDRDVPWQRRLDDDILGPLYAASGTPRQQSYQWKRCLDQGSHGESCGGSSHGGGGARVSFLPLKVDKLYTNVERCSEQQVVDAVQSISVVSALPQAERAQVLDSVRHLLRTHPDLQPLKSATPVTPATTAAPVLEMRYLTEIYSTHTHVQR